MAGTRTPEQVFDELIASLNQYIQLNLAKVIKNESKRRDNIIAIARSVYHYYSNDNVDLYFPPKEVLLSKELTEQAQNTNVLPNINSLPYKVVPDIQDVGTENMFKRAIEQIGKIFNYSYVGRVISLVYDTGGFKFGLKTDLYKRLYDEDYGVLRPKIISEVSASLKVAQNGPMLSPMVTIEGSPEEQITILEVLHTLDTVDTVTGDKPATPERDQALLKPIEEAQSFSRKSPSPSRSRTPSPSFFKKQEDAKINPTAYLLIFSYSSKQQIDATNYNVEAAFKELLTILPNNIPHPPEEILKLNDITFHTILAESKEACLATYKEVVSATSLNKETVHFGVVYDLALPAIQHLQKFNYLHAICAKTTAVEIWEDVERFETSRIKVREIEYVGNQFVVVEPKADDNLGRQSPARICQ